MSILMIIQSKIIQSTTTSKNDRPKHDIFFSHTQPSVMIIMKLRVIMIPIMLGVQ